METVLVTMASLHPSRIVTYLQNPQGSNQRHVQKLVGAEIRKAAQGRLSEASRKRLKLAIGTLAFTAKWKTCYQKATGKHFRFKINFITLTLPADTRLSDKEITAKVLGQFLRKWKKRSPKLLYIWKAEVQDNGRLHYHLTTNTYVHYQRLKIWWNRECQKNGIYHKKLGIEANSTDVHSVKNINNIAAYLTSYIAKKDLYKKPLKRWHRVFKKQLGDENKDVVHLPKNYFKNLKRPVQCALWGASKPLLNSKTSVQLEGTDYGAEFNIKFANRYPEVQDDYFAYWRLNGDELKSFPLMYQAWKQNLNNFLKEDSESEKVIYQV